MGGKRPSQEGKAPKEGSGRGELRRQVTTWGNHPIGLGIAMVAKVFSSISIRAEVGAGTEEEKVVKKRFAMWRRESKDERWWWWECRWGLLPSMHLANSSDMTVVAVVVI